ncbi:hypothetical protein CRYUN_Cryun16bG0077600 [Craigia yunnanensis]
MLDEIHERNLVAWTTMISGYAMMGLVNEAFGAFREMQMLGVVPDKITMVSVISACSAAGALNIGWWIHVYIEKQAIETDILLSTALTNMYATCGYTERAKEIFRENAGKRPESLELDDCWIGSSWPRRRGFRSIF